MPSPFTIGAFAIILDPSERVLLCHRRDLDLWNLPGGGVESGEMPTEAVMREVKEETGLEVAIERLADVYGKEDKDELVFSFVCRVTGGQLALTDESKENVYFPLDQLPANTIPKQAKRIRDALSLDSQPILRRQYGPSARDWLKENMRPDPILCPKPAALHPAPDSLIWQNGV